MKYHFKELVDLSKLQKLTDKLFAATSLPSAVVSMDGEVLTRSGWRKICTDFHGKHSKIEKDCVESDTTIRRKPDEGEPFAIYRCPMGLVEASAPIVIEGEHVADLFSGQVFLAPPDGAVEEKFRQQAGKLELDEAKCMEAYREIPIFSEEKFRAGISFLASFAELIADLGLARMREMELTASDRESEEQSGSILHTADHKTSERELREERDLIERIMETSPAGIVRANADGVPVYSNRRAAEILGTQLSEVPLRAYDNPVWKITDFDGNSLPEAELPFSTVKRTGRPVFDMRHAVTWSNGRKIYLSVNAAPLFDERGEFEGVVASLEDITEKFETGKNYRMLFQKMINGFALHEVICDDEGHPVDYRFLAVNPAFERLTGLKGDTLIGKTVLEVMPDTEPFWIERYGRVALTGDPVDFESYSGELDRFFHVTAFKPAERQFACIFEDVTRNKMAEEALKESEARFRSFMDHFPDPAFIKDKQARYVYGNRQVHDTWHTSPEKLAGTTADKYFNKEDAARIESRDRIVLNERRVVDEEIMIQNGPGEVEWRREIRFPIGMPNGEWLIGGISIDISEQIHAKEERQRLIAAIEQTGESLVITSPNGTIEYVNPAFEKITGYPRQEITGRNPRFLKSGYHDESVYKTLWDTIRSGKRWNGRLINRRKNGTCYTSEYIITPVKNNQGAIMNYIWISRDVSGEIELEKRMAQAQKMESIGNLASGIAHDFNNILFPILGLAEMLLEDLPVGSPERENAEEIHKAGKRGSALVKQILSFGRKGEQKKVPIRIQQVLGEVLKLARATIPANIEMNQDIPVACGSVLADPTQLHQIVMNLITNALHAVEEKGGKISVRLKETTMRPDDLLTF